MNRCGPQRRVARLALVLAGIVLGQVILFWPSLSGRKVLLPLDKLRDPSVYIPHLPETEHLAEGTLILADPVYQFEPLRHFAASEIHQGRFPAWIPYEFGGVPYIEPRFSPFAALQFCCESPAILAWSQLAVALVAGLGIYVFLRRELGISFWPAAIAAWCYPLTGFFILWEGCTLTPAVCWLPWSLLAVAEIIRGARFGPLGVALVTCLVLLSGRLDVGGQLLLASGLYGLWRLAELYWRREVRLAQAVAKLAAAWMLGFLLAMPQILPMLDYSGTSLRFAQRSAGAEERPPVGLEALPQTVLPDVYGGYGNWSIGNFRFAKDEHPESSAAAYTGLIATLLVAPLAWCSRRHRRFNLFWAFLILLGLSWSLNLPGFVQVLRLPGLNMMSHNRFVFVVSFALLALAATGLEAMLEEPLRLPRWLWVAPAALACLGLWCGHRALFLPEPLASRLADSVRHGSPFLWVHDLDGLKRVQTWFVGYYWRGVPWCAVGLLGWLLVWQRPSWRTKLVVPLSALLIGELLLFAHGRVPQCDPKYYYPPIPVLQQVAKAPDRMVGYQCLPPALSVMCGMRDVRGYDAVDPDRIVELLSLAADPDLSLRCTYALTQFFVPKITVQPDKTLRLSPVLDLLGVRYVVFQQPPFAGARTAFEHSDFWVMENPSALPRVFVPQRAELVADKSARLTKLADPQFDPREVAFVESTVHLPDSCRGTADIVQETPTRITVSTSMETPGLVVLSDRWDKGWVATYNGGPVPILPADHAIRGVVVPAGQGTLEFRYAPSSFTWGLRLCGVGVGMILVWLGLLVFQNPRRQIAAAEAAQG